MDTQSAGSSTDAAGSKEIRKLELGPALKRDRLLRRVVDAGKRLPQNSPRRLARPREVPAGSGRATEPAGDG